MSNQPTSDPQTNTQTGSTGGTSGNRRFDYRQSGNDYQIVYGDQLFATVHKIANVPLSMRDPAPLCQTLVQHLNSIASASQEASASSGSQR